MIKKIINIIKRKNFFKNSGIQIGEGCEIYSDVNFGSEPYLIKIGDHVRITQGVRFITHDGGVWVLRRLKNMPEIDLIRKIEVGNNVHIGIDAIIMPGVKIGDNCIIGCGAIVTKDIPSNSIAVGVPARVIGNIDEYFEKHKNDFDNTKEMNYEEKKKYLIKKYKD